MSLLEKIIYREWYKTWERMESKKSQEPYPILKATNKSELRAPRNLQMTSHIPIAIIIITIIIILVASEK